MQEIIVQSWHVQLCMTKSCALDLALFPGNFGRSLEQMDRLLSDQLVPHGLLEPEAATAAVGEDEKRHTELMHWSERSA
jgi:hypothetical protein